MRYLLMLCLTLAATVAQADTYRWLDAGGRTVVSDTPPPGKSKGVVKSGEKPEAGDNQSFATKKRPRHFRSPCTPRPSASMSARTPATC